MFSIPVLDPNLISNSTGSGQFDSVNITGAAGLTSTIGNFSGLVTAEDGITSTTGTFTGLVNASDGVTVSGTTALSVTSTGGITLSSSSPLTANDGITVSNAAPLAVNSSITSTVASPGLTLNTNPIYVNYTSPVQEMSFNYPSTSTPLSIFPIGTSTSGTANADLTITSIAGTSTLISTNQLEWRFTTVITCGSTANTAGQYFFQLPLASVTSPTYKGPYTTVDNSLIQLGTSSIIIIPTASSTPITTDYGTCTFSIYTYISTGTPTIIGTLNVGVFAVSTNYTFYSSHITQAYGL